MIHSPLVGPLTLTPLAAELRDYGIEVDLPDLRSALARQRPVWRAMVELAAATAMSGAIDVIVGHSGAGALLPLLADQLQPQVVVYVDAVVPGDGAHYKATLDFIAFLDSLPRTGALLPPWNTWWGDETMVRLVPDAELRGRIIADTPSVPRSFYDDPILLPTGWMSRRGNCFLQLGPAYAEELARAETYGWEIARMEGQHLDVASKPVDVASVLVGLIDRVRNS